MSEIVIKFNKPTIKSVSTRGCEKGKCRVTIEYIREENGTTIHCEMIETVHLETMVVK